MQPTMRIQEITAQIEVHETEIIATTDELNLAEKQKLKLASDLTTLRTREDDLTEDDLTNGNYDNLDLERRTLRVKLNTQRKLAVEAQSKLDTINTHLEELRAEKANLVRVKYQDEIIRLEAERVAILEQTLELEAQVNRLIAAARQEGISLYKYDFFGSRSRSALKLELIGDGTFTAVNAFTC